MSVAVPPPALARTTAWVYLLLTLAGLTAAGRLAMGAWLERPSPEGLPRIGASAERAAPVLAVIVDGLREQAVWGEPTAMPYLVALAQDGVGGVAKAGNPTLTAACVRTLLTGRWPDLLTGLRNFNARPSGGSWVEYLCDLGAKAAHAGDAAVAQLCAPHLPLADVLAFTDQGPTDQGQCDAQAVPFARERIALGCDLVTLHLTGPDHAGHKHGATGEPYRRACGVVDGYLRTLVGEFRARHPGATVLVAADHGVSDHGTHGGGEESARRAPFVLVGPGVARARGVEVPQAALAPSLCALLGLPQPPLADAPPAAELLALPADALTRAFDAHVQARAWVARALGSRDVEPLDRKRAEVALERLGAAGLDELRRLSEELESLARPQSWPALLTAPLFALLGVLALTRARPALAGLALPPRAALGALALFVAALTLLPGAPRWLVPLAAAALALLALRTLARAARGGARETVPVLLGILAAALLAAGGVAARDALERGAAPAGSAALAFGVKALALLVGASLVALAARALASRPAAALALAGAALGALLSLRPLIDPFVSVTGVVAAASGAALLAALVRVGAWREQRAATLALLAVVAALLVVPRLLAPGSGSWVQALALRDAGWALGALGASAGLLALLPRPWFTPRDRAAVGTALVALLLAHLGRRLSDLPGESALLTAFGPQVLGLAALVLAQGPDLTAGGRTAARLLATLALGVRLTASDAEVAAFALATCAAALATRVLPARRPSPGAAAAALLLLLRTALFHALGGVESFSTVDVGAGFLGLGGGAAAQGGGVSPIMVVAGLQVALRFALPWLLLLTVLAHAAADAGGLRALAADLALTFAGRAAVLLALLWPLSTNAWWVEQASTVYALGAADVVLLVAAAAALGALRRDGALLPPPAPSIMRPCSA